MNSTHNAAAGSDKFGAQSEPRAGRIEVTARLTRTYVAGPKSRGGITCYTREGLRRGLEGKGTTIFTLL
jgi:hypothetical protein